MTKGLLGFGGFWWNFVIADNPTLAVGGLLVAAIGLVLDQSRHPMLGTSGATADQVGRDAGPARLLGA